MKSNEYKKLAQKLVELDKNAEEFDKALIALRIQINDVLWDLIELKKEKAVNNSCYAD
ncbi:MAG: hypothetical protein AAB583_05995 [Patescibacteria group bacterium]